VVTGAGPAAGVGAVATGEAAASAVAQRSIERMKPSAAARWGAVGASRMNSR
jgi:hypothetical protein